MALVAQYTRGRTLGLPGEPTVNVPVLEIAAEQTCPLQG
jgi:K+-transporting ATPase c subunit